VHKAAVELASALVGCVDNITSRRGTQSSSDDSSDTTKVGIFIAVFSLLRLFEQSIGGCGRGLGEVLARVAVLWAERAPDMCHSLTMANKVGE
jgi:hypothetical protein